MSCPSRKVRTRCDTTTYALRPPQPDRLPCCRTEPKLGGSNEPREQFLVVPPGGSPAPRRDRHPAGRRAGPSIHAGRLRQRQLILASGSPSTGSFRADCGRACSSRTLTPGISVVCAPQPPRPACHAPFRSLRMRFSVWTPCSKHGPHNNIQKSRASALTRSDVCSRVSTTLVGGAGRPMAKREHGLVGGAAGDRGQVLRASLFGE